MLDRVVSGVVLPAVPDHVEPGSREDPGGVGVVLAAGAGSAEVWLFPSTRAGLHLHPTP